MGILTKALQKVAQRFTVLPSFKISETAGNTAWFDLFGGGETNAGVAVSEWTAMNYSAYWACVRIISENVGQLPLHFYRKTPQDSRDRITDHPAAPLLKDAPNDEMSAISFKEAEQGHLCTWGNCYAQKRLNRRGELMSLHPLLPSKMAVKRDEQTRKLRYDYHTNSGVEPLSREDVLHIPGFGYNGIVGFSPLQFFRETIGLGLAGEEFAARSLGQGTHPSGVVEYEAGSGPKTADGVEKHKKSFVERYSGLGKSHSVLTLMDGGKFKQITVNPKDAMLLDSRRFQVAEMARVFGVPMHMLAELDRATHTNIEHQAIEFVRYCLGPWLVRWEQCLNAQLLTMQERRAGYYFEFKIDALLRADIKTRYDAYAVARQWGWMDGNEIRERENMSPMPGGKIVFMPLNMVPLGDSDAAQRSVRRIEGTSEEKQKAVRHLATLASRDREIRDNALAVRGRLRDAWSRPILDAAGRLVNKETLAVGRKIEKFLKAPADLAGLEEALKEFYSTWPDEVESVLKASILSYAEEAANAALIQVGADVTSDVIDTVSGKMLGYLKDRSAGWASSSENQLRQLIADAEEEARLEALQTRLTEWQETRPGKEQLRHAVTAGNRAAWMAWSLAGILEKIWNAVGKNCPLCNSLHGTKVGIERVFLDVGSVVDPGGVPPLEIKRQVLEPQLHGGCDCYVDPVLV